MFNDDTLNFSCIRNAFDTHEAAAIWDIFVDGNLGGWEKSDTVTAAMLYAEAQNYLYTDSDEAQEFLQASYKLLEHAHFEYDADCEWEQMAKYIARIHCEQIRIFGYINS